MASARNGTLYVGVTSDLHRRAMEHREGSLGGFTARYGCKTLVWHERHDNIERAIQREKSLKRYHRAWKLRLIEALNPGWSDLFDSFADRDNPFQPSFTPQYADVPPETAEAGMEGLDPRDGARG